MRNSTQGDMGLRKGNPIIFFDIAIGNEILGRMRFELRADLVPKTSENFRALATGERGRCTLDNTLFHLKGTVLHRIVKNSHCQGGDLKNGDGTWSHSVLSSDQYFPDENFILRHTGPGVLSMCNKGRDTNGSAFFITFAENSSFDEHHVVFGCVADEESLQVLYAIERLGSISGRPTAIPLIIDCGQLYPKR